MGRAKVWLFVVAVVVAAGIVKIARRQNSHDRVAEARDSLVALRAGTDSCRAAVAAGEAELQDWNADVDSMRARVRDYEALDPRGVPQDSYAVYMEAFTAYNDSAAAFDPKVDSLRAALERCRALAERHNMMLDTVRRLMAERLRR